MIHPQAQGASLGSPTVWKLCGALQRRIGASPWLTHVSIWVWVKIKPPGDHRFWSMLPLTRASLFGVTLFLTHSLMAPTLSRSVRSSVVQWHPFPFFLGGCPTKYGLPQKGSFFSSVTEQVRKLGRKRFGSLVSQTPDASAQSDSLAHSLLLEVLLGGGAM